MKVTDEEIIRAVLRRHAEIAARAVVSWHGGNHFSLCPCTPTQRHHATLLSSSMRRSLKLEITQPQLLTRIRKLISKGELRAVRPGDEERKVFYYRYNGPAPEDLYDTSRAFWRSKGLGDNAGDSVNMSMERKEELCSECTDYLLGQLRGMDL